MSNASPFTLATEAGNSTDPDVLRQRLFDLVEAMESDKIKIAATIKASVGSDVSGASVSEIVDTLIEMIDGARLSILKSLDSSASNTTFDEAIELILAEYEKLANVHDDEPKQPAVNTTMFRGVKRAADGTATVNGQLYAKSYIDQKLSEPQAAVAPPPDAGELLELRKKLAAAEDRNLDLRESLCVQLGFDSDKAVAKALKEKILTADEAKLDVAMRLVVQRTPKGWFTKDLLGESPDSLLTAAMSRNNELTARIAELEDLVSRKGPPSEVHVAIDSQQALADAKKAIYWLESAEERLAEEKLSKIERVNLKGDVKAALSTLREALGVTVEEVADE